MDWVLSKTLEKSSYIEEFERKYNVRFPKSFTNVVKEKNAGRPRPNVFDSEKNEEYIAKALLSFDPGHKENIWSTYNTLEKRLPANVIPFMIDQFGNYLCFFFDPLEDEPSIVFWKHELDDDQLEKVSDNFNDLLNCFYELD
jgi:hypothetical protein